MREVSVNRNEQQKMFIWWTMSYKRKNSYKKQ